MTRSRKRKLQHAGIAMSSMPLASTLLTGIPVAQAQQASDSGGLEEVVVSAQKRDESLQNVPLSITALGTARLEELHVSDFNDYVKFLPSVSSQTLGPGFGLVYMRGVSSGGDGNHSGSLPSVGTYLDEQPITTIQGALDIHVYDVARVEALAGPQGTLYGASSQAGTIRIITNKPDPSAFKAGYDLQGSSLSGEFGHVLEGFMNIPLSATAAIRLVGWTEHDPGYIDNVRGQLTFPTSGITFDNASQAKKHYNDIDTYGARAALKIDLNDTWTITPTVMGQDERTHGTFGFDPTVGDLKVTHFFPENTKDRWGQASLTVEGKFNKFDVVYAGAFMKRDDVTNLDYTDYAFFYDQALGYGVYFYDNANELINPAQHIHGVDHYKKQSHEFRISSGTDSRFRWVGGLFLQRQQHNIFQDYIVDNLNDGLEVTGFTDTIWLTAQDRTDRDYAAFGEASFDITPKLTVTGGIRFFKAKNSLAGFFGYGNGYSSHTGESQCFTPVLAGSGVDGSPCTNLDKTIKETGNTPKVNFTYHFDESRLVYATYSEGFRPGGINRKANLLPYKADFLNNYELGWKTSWINNRLRFNGAVFWADWKDFQYSYLGANGLTEIRNAGQARIKGLESSLDWAATAALTISGGIALIDAKLTQNYCGTTYPDGTPVTNCSDPNAPPGTSLQAPSGTQLPVTPKFKGNLTARFNFPIGNLEAHVQGAYVYQAKSWSTLALDERAIVGDQKAYGIADFTFGVDKGPYSAELFLTNAFDERADLSRTTECSILTPDRSQPLCGPRQYTYTTLPRTIGVRFGQKF